VVYNIKTSADYNFDYSQKFELHFHILKCKRLHSLSMPTWYAHSFSRPLNSAWKVRTAELFGFKRSIQLKIKLQLLITSCITIFLSNSFICQICSVFLLYACFNSVVGQLEDSILFAHNTDTFVQVSWSEKTSCILRACKCAHTQAEAQVFLPSGSILFLIIYRALTIKD
jgi:hypothetical protein